MAQLVTRVENELAAAVDELIAAGVVANRSEAVRLGLERLVDGFRRHTTGTQIIEGYLFAPQADDEVAWPDDASAQMIADEPW